jgi:predicted alpha/beta-hydrolase family hydrolase
MVEGRKSPDRLPQLIECHRAALRRACADHEGPVILVGKSMGGRVGCHLSLEEEVSGLICFGYPLCAGGDPSKLRDQVLLALRAPVLFVQGTRDPLCPLDLLEQVRQKMTAEHRLHVVEAGDHSLQVTKTHLKKTGETQDDIDQRITRAIQDFVAALPARR